MKYKLKRAIERPQLKTKDDIAVEVNSSFEQLTHYSSEAIVGKSIDEVQKMLKYYYSTPIANLETTNKFYIFTANNNPREVIIDCDKTSENEKTYIIEEVKNSRIENKFLFLQHLLNDSKIGVSIYSLPDFVILYSNDSHLVKNSAPYNNRENYLGKVLKDTLTIEEWQYICSKLSFQHYLTQKEEAFIDASQKTTYWDTQITPIIEGGKGKYLIKTCFDVSEKVINRKLAEERNSKLEAIIDNMTEEVAIFDISGKFTMLNKAAKKSPFFKTEKIIDAESYDTFSKRLDENGAQIALEDMPSRKVLNGEVFTGYRVDSIFDDELYFREISGTPIYDENGDFIAGVLVCNDISQRLIKEEQKLLKIQFELIEKTINSLELPYSISSYPDFKIKFMNSKSFADVQSFNKSINTLSDIIGKNLIELFNYSDAEKLEIKSKLKHMEIKSERNFYLQREVIMGDRNTFIKIMFQPLFNLKDQITEIVTIGLDITDEVNEKKKVEEILRLQDEMFFNISHELRTPLNSIYCANHLIDTIIKGEMTELNNKTINNYTDIIKQNCYRFTKLINNIIDASKLEAGYSDIQLSNKNIVYVIEEIVQSVSDFIKDKGIKMIFDTDIEEKIIACDPYMLERVILNLISNAIKFSKSDGTIFVNIYDRGKEVEINVIDNGIGIDLKQQKNIFNRFHQVDKSLKRNAEGSGIGLSLVKAIVELHGGTISVESTIGKGSSFKILLPVYTIDEKTEGNENRKLQSNKIEMMQIEFSDIYSITEKTVKNL